MANGTKAVDLISKMNPQQIAAVLRAKRSRLMQMSEGTRNKFLGMVFRRYFRQPLVESGISDADLTAAEKQWTAGISGKGGKQLPTGYGTEPVKPPSALATAGASAIGSLLDVGKTAVDWERKMPHPSGRDNPLDRWLDAQRAWAEKTSGKIQSAAELRPMAGGAGRFAGDIFALAPAFMLGEGLIPKAGKEAPALLRMLSRAGRLGLGTATAAPLQTTDPKEIGRAAAYGAALGPIADPIVEKLAGFLGRLLERTVRTGVGRAVSKAAGGVSPEIKTQVANDVEQLAKERYGKAWAELGQDERNKIGEEIFARYKKPETRPKATAKPTAPGAPGTAAGQASDAQWRRQQYITLRKAGIDVKKGSAAYELVHSGKSAEDILNFGRPGVATQVTAAAARAENPQVDAAVKGVTEAAKVGSPEDITKKAAEYKKEIAGKPPAQVDKMEREFMEKKPTEPTTVTKVPEGVSGVTDAQRKLLQRLDEVMKREAETKSPLVRTKLRQSIANIKKALGGDEAAAKKLAEAERVGLIRAKAKETELPTPPPGFEKGEVTPTAPEKVPFFEMIDNLKNLKIPGFDMEKFYAGLEALRKRSTRKITDEELEEGVDSIYRTLGKKLGIDDADDLPLEELYKRVTAAGGSKEVP
jgi:hypothetical protein